MDPETHEPEELEIRLTRDNLEAGIGGVAFFGTMGVSSTICALLNVDGSFGHPIMVAVFLGTGWGSLTLLSCWMIATYSRHRLFVSRDIIRIIGWFGSREIQFDNIDSVKWDSKNRDGALYLDPASGSLKVRFGNYTYQEREMLIRFLRTALAQLPQEGWEQFESRCRPPTTDYATLQTKMHGHMRFAIIAWGIAIPIMYAIMILQKLNGGLPRANWLLISLAPLAFATLFLGLMWLTARMNLAKAEVRHVDH